MEKRKNLFLTPEVVKKKCIENFRTRNALDGRKIAFINQSTLRMESHVDGSCLQQNDVSKRDLFTNKSSGTVSLRFAIFHCTKDSKAQTLDLPLQKSKDGLICMIGQNCFPKPDACVSSDHCTVRCEIDQDSDRFCIFDANSANGTYTGFASLVEAKSLTPPPACKGPMPAISRGLWIPLEVGSFFRVGNTILRFDGQSPRSRQHESNKRKSGLLTTSVTSKRLRTSSLAPSSFYTSLSSSSAALPPVPAAAMANFSRWLRLHGCGTANVVLRRGAMGCQVHAARSLRAGDLLVRIPLSLALSHSRASRLPVGRAVAAFVKRRYRPALFPQLSRKAVARGAMLMVMIANRCRGVGPWREYVHTLPDSFGDALWWPQALVNALPQELELGREVASHRELVSATFAFFFPSLWDAHPSLFPRQVFTAAAWRWANSVYSSRAFPESWARATHEDGPGGVMLPLVDMLNHQDGAPVQWRAEDGYFELRTTAAVEAGQQVFNDYGRRSGAQWCARFGFVEAHHSGERVALRLPALLAGRGLDTLVAARHTLLHGNAARVYSLTDRIPALQPALMRTLRLLLASEEEVQACLAGAREARVSSARCFSGPPGDGDGGPCTHSWGTERAAAEALARGLADQLALVRSLRGEMGASGPESMCTRWFSAQERLIQRSLACARQHSDASEKHTTTPDN